MEAEFQSNHCIINPKNLKRLEKNWNESEGQLLNSNTCFLVRQNRSYLTALWQMSTQALWLYMSNRFLRITKCDFTFMQQQRLINYTIQSRRRRKLYTVLLNKLCTPSYPHLDHCLICHLTQWMLLLYFKSMVYNHFTTIYLVQYHMWSLWLRSGSQDTLNFKRSGWDSNFCVLFINILFEQKKVKLCSKWYSVGNKTEIITTP
jgi:hypothetical protein